MPVERDRDLRRFDEDLCYPRRARAGDANRHRPGGPAGWNSRPPESDLRPDDQVITSGHEKLAEGVAVQVRAEGEVPTP